MPVRLVFQFVSRENHISGVDQHHHITVVLVRTVRWFVFSLQHRRQLRGQPSENLSSGVDKSEIQTVCYHVLFGRVECEGGGGVGESVSGSESGKKVSLCLSVCWSVGEREKKRRDTTEGKTARSAPWSRRKHSSLSRHNDTDRETSWKGGTDTERRFAL